MLCSGSNKASQSQEQQTQTHVRRHRCCRGKQRRMEWHNDMAVKATLAVEKQTDSSCRLNCHGTGTRISLTPAPGSICWKRGKTAADTAHTHTNTHLTPEQDSNKLFRRDSASLEAHRDFFFFLVSCLLSLLLQSPFLHRPAQISPLTPNAEPVPWHVGYQWKGPIETSARTPQARVYDRESVLKASLPYLIASILNTTPDIFGCRRLFCLVIGPFPLCEVALQKPVGVIFLYLVTETSSVSIASRGTDWCY